MPDYEIWFPLTSVSAPSGHYPVTWPEQPVPGQPRDIASNSIFCNSFLFLYYRCCCCCCCFCCWSCCCCCWSRRFRLVSFFLKIFFNLLFFHNLCIIIPLRLLLLLQHSFHVLNLFAFCGLSKYHPLVVIFTIILFFCLWYFKYMFACLYKHIYYVIFFHTIHHWKLTFI